MKAYSVLSTIDLCINGFTIVNLRYTRHDDPQGPCIEHCRLLATHLSPGAAQPFCPILRSSGCHSCHDHAAVPTGHAHIIVANAP